MTSPLVFIIFGATGDLMARKLMPAMFRLYEEGNIHEQSYVIGIGRRALSQSEFTGLMKDALEKRLRASIDEERWKRLSGRILYVQGLFEESSLYEEVVRRLDQIDKEMNACVPRFFYLATPPQHYEAILTHLKNSSLSEGCGQGTINFTRVLIEKPFGKDLATAKHLDELLATIFEERQIYRIDHYLGKETVQNILALRFANGIFEPTWSHEFIDHVQITLAEHIGVGTRGSFYDGVGALRDVVQNHMLEMLAIIAMEQPKGFDAASIRDARVAAMQAIDCIEPEEVASSVVRGQYTGYTQEEGVDRHSTTETFVALRLFLDSPRWKGVPFYLRTGKGLSQKTTEISLHYKKPLCAGDVCFFNPEKTLRNVLSIRIQPDEGVTLRVMAKKPGYGMDLLPAMMDFSYTDLAEEGKQSDPYARLLLDAIAGDQTLFARTDGIESSWQFMMGILEGWKLQGNPIVSYEKGTDGPQAAHDLIEKDGRKWFLGKK